MLAPQRNDVAQQEPEWLSAEVGVAAADDAEQLIAHADAALQRWQAPARQAPRPGPRWSTSGGWALAGGLALWLITQHFNSEPPAPVIAAAPATPTPQLEFEGEWPALVSEEPEAASRRPASVQAPTGDVLTAYGTELKQRGEFRRAEAVFLRAIRVAPQSADAWSGLAVCRYELGQKSAAEAAGRRALAIDPRHREAAVLMGFMAQVRGAYQDSRELYLRSLAGGPDGDVAAELKSVLQQLPEQTAVAANRRSAVRAR